MNAVRRVIVHRAPAPNYYSDLDDDNSYTAVWETEQRPILITDVEEATDDAERLARLIWRLRAGRHVSRWPFKSTCRFLVVRVTTRADTRQRLFVG